MERYALFLGCNIPWFYPDIEQSIRKTLPRLGIELEDIEGYTCCTAPAILPSTDLVAWLAVAARNISMAEGMGLNIVTGCNGCYSILNHAKFFLSDDKTKEAINGLLSKVNREYKGVCEVHHVIRAIHDNVGTNKIKSSIKKRLEGFKVAIATGCHVIWPSELFHEDPVRPRILREIVEPLGAEIVDYSKFLRCCGGSGLRATALDKSYKLASAKLGSIVNETEADMVIANCPSCFAQLDESQVALREEGVIDYSIPIFYYTQVLGLCMGLDPKEIACNSLTSRDEIIKRIVDENG